jgi:hypothetical protein
VRRGRARERSAGARRTPRLLRCWLAGSSIWQLLLRAAARLARDRVCAMRLGRRRIQHHDRLERIYSVFLIQSAFSEIWRMKKVKAHFDSARILNAHVAFPLETYLAM